MNKVKIRVKPKHMIIELIGRATMSPDMLKFCGQELEAEVLTSGPYHYKTVEDMGNGFDMVHRWHEQWVEVVPELTPDMSNEEKPPIGLKPREIYEFQINKNRLLDILNVLREYVQTDTLHKQEWVNELNDLMKNRKL